MNNDSEASDTEIRRDVVEEAAELLDSIEDSKIWMTATDEEAAAASLAAGLLRGELDDEHPPAVRAASGVLE